MKKTISLLLAMLLALGAVFSCAAEGHGTRTLRTVENVELYAGRDANGTLLTQRTPEIRANVVADGSVVQWVIGWLRDLWLRMRACSLY